MITNRSGHTPQAAVAAAAAAAAVAAAGQLAGTTGGTESRQTPVVSTTSGTTSVQQASVPSSRLVFPCSFIGKKRRQIDRNVPTPKCVSFCCSLGTTVRK